METFMLVWGLWSYLIGAVACFVMAVDDKWWHDYSIVGQSLIGLSFVLWPVTVPILAIVRVLQW